MSTKPQPGLEHSRELLFLAGRRRGRPASQSVQSVSLGRPSPTRPTPLMGQCPPPPGPAWSPPPLRGPMERARRPRPADPLAGCGRWAHAKPLAQRVAGLHARAAGVQRVSAVPPPTAPLLAPLSPCKATRCAAPPRWSPCTTPHVSSAPTPSGGSACSPCAV